MRVTVVGSGFVGKATGRGLSKHKNDVQFVDVNKDRIVELKKEGWNIVDTDEQKKLFGDVTMFCVPTPTKGGNIQLQYLREAVTTFAKLLKDHTDYHVAVVRSTVPPKTTQEVVLPLIEKVSGKKAGKDFGVVMQPEYLREATAAEDFERPWLILIGADDDKAGDVIEKLYRPFDAPIERCSLSEAEFQKYVHNVFNAVKIAFFNEMRLVANGEKWDAKRIFQITAESCEGMWNPVYGIRDFGPFDGSCLPKDTRALLEWGDNHGYSLEILRSVIKENKKHELMFGKNDIVRVNYLADITV